MTFESSRAVFLSYASQDAEAATRIAEALRASGVEVWFDQNELVGGDAWDQKIRKQIKECALFVPIISPATNSRAEGYFRLEWKLAVDRSHLMADDQPFLFPIVIGDVSDATARVPDKFREVQWTRLRLDETPTELAARITRLLSGVQQAGEGGRRTEDRRERRAKSGWERWWWLIFPIVSTPVLIVGLLNKQSPPEKPAAVSTPTPSSDFRPPISVAASAAVSEARQLAAKAQLLFEKVDSTQDDFLAAEGLMKRAVALDPSDGLVLAVYSRLNSGFRMRGFDPSAARMEEARSQMERAVRLAPEEPEVWLARGSYLRRAEGDRAEAEQALRKAIAMAPHDTRPWFDLAWAVDAHGDDEEVFALLEKSIDPARPGSGALARYNQFNLRFVRRRFAEGDALVRAAVAELPSSNFVTGLARSEITWKGNATAAVAVIGQLTPERSKEPRSVYFMAYARLLAREPADALNALRRLPADFIHDNYFTGPKGYWEGWAQRQMGNAEAARVAWEGALAVSRREGAGRFNRGLIMQAELLALLGREEEAMRLVLAYEQSGGAQGASRRNAWTHSAAKVYAALGRMEEALPLLEAHLSDKVSNWPLTPALLRLDPLWDKLRDDPRFQKLCEEPPAPVVPRAWPKDPELKKAMALVEGFESIPDDFALAEEIVRRAVDRNPTDVEATTVMALVQGMYLVRGFDRGDERLALTQRYAERALQLAPDDPVALLALGTYLRNVGFDYPRAERVLRRAMELDPADPRPARMLCNLVFESGRTDEGIALAEAHVRRFPRDAITRYELTRLYRNAGRYEDFERELDATLALAPIPNAMVWKARAQFGLHNDLAGMRTWLDRVPERVRGVERTVFTRFLHAAMSAQPEQGLEALRGFPQKWFSDFEYVGPTALLVAELLSLQGKHELARRQYEAALTETQRQKALNPANAGVPVSEFWSLLGLGRKEEARTSFRYFLESINRPYRQGILNNWWFTIVPAALRLGERETALALLRESFERAPSNRAAIRLRLQLDLRMEPFRDDPEIKALLAEPGN